MPVEPLKSPTDLETFLSRFTNYERMQFVKYDKETFGLERMRRLAAGIGNPQASYRSVHVAGTKGKGSTSLILEALLRAEGYRVGTYLSPHVEHLAERIRVDGQQATPEDLAEDLRGMQGALDAMGPPGSSSFPTFFEILTALAMNHFKRRGVSRAIFEVGLGGRLDATNILEPDICAITSIGLEHTQQLGSTIAGIAREKAGILKPATPVVLGPLPPEAAAEIGAIAGELGARLINAAAEAVTPGAPGRLRIAGLDGEVARGPVVGPALRASLAVAVALLERILRRDGRRPSARKVSEALASLELPARMELFARRPPVVLDAAHTPESVRALRLSLEEIRFPRPRVLIFSLALGKEVQPIIEELPRIAEEIIWTRADPVRSIPPEELQALAGRGRAVDSPAEALREALRLQRPVVVTGSFYLAGRLRPFLRPRTRG